MLPLELSSHLLEIPNDVCSLLSQILIGWSLYSRELRKLIGLHWRQHCAYPIEHDMFSCLTHTDMDECLIRPSVCPEKSECVYIAGDYNCECHAGYKYDPEARVCRGMTTSLCSTSAITILYTVRPELYSMVYQCVNL